MTALLLDLDESFKDLNKSIKLTQTGLKGLKGDFGALDRSFSNVDKAVKGTNQSLTKLVNSAKLVGGIGLTFAAAADAAFKFKAAIDIAGAVYEGYKKLNSVVKTLNFAEAITGSDELRKNMEQLEQTSNVAIDSIRQGFNVLFNNDEFNQFASRSVAAYAQVEQAAYRLGTITVSGNEQAIDKIKENIESMRALQKATNDTKGSVEILNAQYDIASAGFTKSKDNLNVGKAAIGLSEAGFGGLEGSTNSVVRALRALGEGSEMAEKRASQLFQTTNVGLLTLDQLTPEVGGLAVQAKQLGVDFSEMLGSIAGLTTQGVSSAEAGTRITSLLSDIAAGSAEANLYLSQFRDEAGKPIQINATVLKNKGIAGVIADIQKATGGRAENIQKVFSNQMSIEAVQLFSSLGKKTLEEYTQSIDQSSGKKLEDAASGRSKTVTGAFEQAKVKSQKGVESFGAGNALSVVESIAKTNKVVESFSISAAEGIGSLTGKLQNVQTVISSIGGTLVSVFSIGAPVVLFGVIFRNIGKLSALFKSTFSKIQKDGETPWQSIKRVAFEFVDNVEKRFYKMIARMQEGIEDVKAKLRDGIEEGKTGVAVKRPEPVQQPLKAPDGNGITRAKAVEGQAERIEAAKKAANKNTRFNLGDVVSSGVNKSLPLLKSFGAGLAKTSLIAAGAAIGLEVAGGWMETIGSVLNKSSNPQIMEMGKGLSQLDAGILKSIPNLKTLANEFQGLKDPTESSGDAVVDTINNIGSAWNNTIRFISGGSIRYTQTVNELNKVLTEVESKVKTFEGKEIGAAAFTEEGVKASKKVQTGQILTGEDEAALKKEVELEKQLLDVKIQAAQQKLESANKNGNTNDIKIAQDELTATKARVEAQKKERDLQLGKDLGNNALRKFRSLDTTIPLALAIPKQNETAIKTQLSDLGAEVSKVFSQQIVDPKQFYDLMPQIENSLGAIETQVELDPQSANQLLTELKSTIQAAGGDFDRILASEPKIRQRYSQILTASTNASLGQVKSVEAGQTAILKALQSSGMVTGGGVSARLGDAIQKSIDSQIQLLEKELNDSATTQTRKIELEQQVAEANAQKLTSALETVTNTVNEEYAAKEKLISFTNNLANSFGNLAGTTLLADTVVGKYLTTVQQQMKANSGEIQTNANKKIAEVSGKVEALRKISQGEGKLAEEAKQQLPQAERMARDEIDSIKVNAALAEVAASMDLAAAKVKEEFAARTRLIAINESLSSSFSTLASTAGSLFQNSGLGATLSRFAAELNSSTGKARTEYDEQNRMLEERNKNLNEAVNKAEQSGADADTIAKLQKAADTDNAQKPVEQSYLRQKLVLDTLNERLSVMSAEVNEVTDALSKNAGLVKDRLDFEQRQKDIALESNKSGTNLQSALIGAFSKNNPFAAMLQQRLDYQQAEDEATGQKAKNVTEAKKEVLDLTLQKAQLTLEQQSYENALTQTQLLADLVAVGSGGEAQFSNSQAVQDRLNSLPQLIENSKQVAGERLNLVNQKIGFVDKELTAKNTNVDREKFAKQLNGLSSGGQFNPANVDKLQEVLSNSTQSLSTFRRQNVEVGSLRDSSFQAEVARMNDLGNSLGRNSMQQAGRQAATQTQQSQQQQRPTNIQAPVSIALNITGADAANFNKNMEQNMKTYVSKEIQNAMGKLGKQVLVASRNA